MTFRIHAAGTRGYRYTRDNCPDEGIFQAAEIITALQGLEPNVGSVVETAADQVTPSVSVLDGVRAMGRMEMLQLLKDSVGYLAICDGASDGWIAVAPSQSHTLWPDTTSFARYEFYPGDDPGSEFVQRIIPALTATDLNDMGVFRYMAIALGGYSNVLNEHGRPRILIQLSH
jgi:hypothetical protein